MGGYILLTLAHAHMLTAEHALFLTLHSEAGFCSEAAITAAQLCTFRHLYIFSCSLCHTRAGVADHQKIGCNQHDQASAS